MKKEKQKPLSERRADLDLFLARTKYVPLPEPYASLFRRDKKAEKARDEKLEKLEQKLSEAKAPIVKAWLNKQGLSPEDMQKALAAKEKALSKYHEGIRVPLSKKPSAGNPIRLEPIPMEERLPVVQSRPLCKYVIVRVCQHKVCVDDPVAVSVDNGIDEVDAPVFQWYRQYDQFGLIDSVEGREWFDLIEGHQERTRTHTGTVTVNMSRTFLAFGKVRRVGVVCTALPGLPGIPPGLNNCYYAEGDHGTFEWGTDWGTVREWTTFQVRSKTANGPWIYHVPWSDAKQPIVDCYSDSRGGYGQLGFIPQERYVDIYQTFPQGTEFLIDWGLQYEITGHGNEGFALISHQLQLNPYMNLEACRWEW